MVKPIKTEYTASDSLVAQGRNVAKYERKGYYCHQGGNGTYRMVKPSKTILFFEVDGEMKSESIKDLIREAYNINRVGEKQLDRFFCDLQSGSIKLDYSEQNGLSII